MKMIALAIVRNSQNQVLIIRRRKVEKGSGEVSLKFAFPGGSLEEGESSEKAAVREVLEETGYSVKADILISERDHPQFPVRVGYVGCSLESEAQLSYDLDEVDQVLWVNIEDLESYFTTDLDPKVAEYLGL